MTTTLAERLREYARIYDESGHLKPAPDTAERTRQASAMVRAAVLIEERERFEAAAAHLDHTAAQGVTVKPLEWREWKGEILGNAPYMMNYCITVLEGGAAHLEGIGAFLSVDGAKAAAQADYEKRILSALSPAPPTPVGETIIGDEHIFPNEPFGLPPAGKAPAVPVAWQRESKGDPSGWTQCTADDAEIYRSRNVPVRPLYTASPDLEAMRRERDEAQMELGATVRKFNCDNAEQFWGRIQKLRTRAEAAEAEVASLTKERDRANDLLSSDELMERAVLSAIAIDKLQAENAALKAALSFYAKAENWRDGMDKRRALLHTKDEG